MANPRYLRPNNLNFCLAHVAEEAGEVIAAIGKTLRWGPDGANPELPDDQRETNADWVRREIADLKGAIERLERFGDFAGGGQ